MSKRWHLTINCSIWAPITYWAHAYLRYILRNPCGVPNIFFRQLWLKDHLKLVKKHVLVVIECFFFLMFVLLMEQLVRNITVMSCHLSKMWNLEECSSVFCRFLMCLETMKLGNSKTGKDSGYIPSPWQVCVFFIYLFFFCGWALNVLIFPVISQLATVWTCKTRIPEHKEQTSRVIPWKIKWTRRMKIYFLHWSPPSIVFCPLISTTLIQNLAQMLRKCKS